MKIITFIIFFISLNGFAYSQENRWIKYCEDEYYHCYYDSKTIIKNGNEISVWEKYIPINKMVDTNGKVVQVLYRLKFNCDEISYVILSGVWCYDTGYKDKVEIDYSRRYITPDDIRETLFNVLCRND